MSKANPLILTKKENEMVEHIPGPYYNNGGIIGPKSVFNSSDNAVCVVGKPNNQTPQDTANARFIIRACNNHKNLLNACMVAIIDLEGIESGHAEKATAFDMDFIRQAIKEATP